MDPRDRLVALMQQGDVAALDALARDYGPRLLAVARRCCRSRHDAEDAVQQALLAAGTSLTTYRGEGSPAAWLSTLVARSCWRMNRAPHDDPARTVHDDAARCACADEAVDAHARAARRQEGDRIGAALMTLPRTDRLMFLMAAEGADTDEIATRFGATHDAVRSRLKRVRKKLRALLDPPRIDGPTALVGHEAHHR